MSGPANSEPEIPTFIAAAERFAAEHGDALAFRLLRWYLRCGEEDIRRVIGKIYCVSIPRNTYEPPEPEWKVLLGILLLPCSIIARKRLFWRPAPATSWNIETIDPPYFERWFRILYDRLPEPKRVTPRRPCPFEGIPVTDPIPAAASPADALRLLLAAPLMLVSAAALASRTGIRLLAPYRQALSIYIVFRAYFLRYPCRGFITFDDESNHPCRWLAFRQTCRGELCVVQNGERIAHPHFAFGGTDRYFVFGLASARILNSLRVSGEFEPVGALCLNERFALIEAERRNGAGAPRYDILFVDQTIHPYHGFAGPASAGLSMLIDHLGSLQRNQPGLKIVYQLRNYGEDREQKTAVLTDISRRLPPEVVIADNQGHGESYVNIIRSALVITFESTLGFEALRMGRKTLFVNFSGDPAETLCADPRFQHVDETRDYGRFERKVLELLARPISEVPAPALERHFAFDGRVQERIAEHLNGKP